jgi:hypothetical protein
MKRLLVVALFGLAAGLVLGPSEARAQGRRLVFEETVIEGKVQKPEITIFITRQNLGTEYVLDLKESFIPKIVKSVEKKPF